jgi:predicted outer membrane protein
MAGNRAKADPLHVIAAKHAIATGRNSGSLRFAIVLADDQHDFAKVNSLIRSVKIFFSGEDNN